MLFDNPHTPEIEPNLSFLPYVAGLYVSGVILCLVLWATHVIKPGEFFSNKSAHASSSEGH